MLDFWSLYYFVFLSLFVALPLLFPGQRLFEVGIWLYAMLMAFWGFGFRLLGNDLLFWMRVEALLGMGLLFASSVIVLSFEPFGRRSFRHLMWLGFAVLSLMGLVFSPWTLISVSTQLQFGWASAIISLVVLVLLGFLARWFYLVCRGLDGLEKIKVLSLFTGWALFSTLTVTSNLLLPYLGLWDYLLWGPRFFSVFLLVALCPILFIYPRYVNGVLERAALYFLIMLTVSFSLPYLFSNAILSFLPVYVIPFALLLLISLVSVGYCWPLSWLFSREKRRFHAVIRDMTDVLNTLMSTEAICSTVTCSLPLLLKVKTVDLVLKHNDGFYYRYAADGTAADQLKDDELQLIEIAELSDDVIDMELLALQDRFGPYTETDALRGSVLSIMTDNDYSLGIPLWRRSDELLGILFLGTPSKLFSFSEEELALLKTVGAHLSSVLQNADYYDRLKDHEYKMGQLNRFGQSIAGHFDFERLHSGALAFLGELYNVDDFIVYVKSETSSSLSYCPLTADDYHLPEELLMDDIVNLSGYHDVFMPFVLDLSDPTLPECFLHYAELFGATHCMVLLMGEAYVPDGCIFSFYGGGNRDFRSLDVAVLKGFSRHFRSFLKSTRHYNLINQHRQFHEDILSNLGVGVLLCDTQLRVTGYNRMSERLFSKSLWQVIGKPLSQLVPDCEALSKIDGALASGDGFQVESTVGADAHPVSLEVAVMDTAVLSVFSDLSVIKQLSKERDQVARLSSLGTMAAGIAHEIRNPLVAVKTFSQLLPQQWDDLAFRQKFLDMVLPQLSRIQAMCESLRRLGEAEAPVRDLVELDELFSGVCELLREDSRFSHVRFEYENTVDFPVSLDHDQFVQVLMNLLINGAQAIVESEGWVKLSSEADDEYVYLYVRDSGCGLSGDAMQHMFDPFFTQKSTGTGLGLSVVRQIVDQHGAKISVQGLDSGGTEFCIRLPYKEVSC